MLIINKKGDNEQNWSNLGYCMSDINYRLNHNRIRLPIFHLTPEPLKTLHESIPWLTLSGQFTAISLQLWGDTIWVSLCSQSVSWAVSQETDCSAVTQKQLPLLWSSGLYCHIKGCRLFIRSVQSFFFIVVVVLRCRHSTRWPLLTSMLWPSCEGRRSD